ncbi:YdcH family protein [Bosea minatitlanensis]|uniref:YdcH family protein n=1 Tax=Bosea minatitlanensis TaxID=128782 RepID=A0ABW0F6N8_9HYPH|nr:YdcH family protein [Bosea minatitlanensis]MCT4495886.1 YdcH family protein [Bosea minatitlanensis]
MSNTPHTLADEFPGQMDAIHKLKVSNAEFARLLEQYDQVNDQVHLAETKIEPIDDLSEVELRKRRLQIKDEIARALADAS